MAVGVKLEDDKVGGTASAHKGYLEFKRSGKNGLKIVGEIQ